MGGTKLFEKGKKIKDETNEIEELVELSEKLFKVEKIPAPNIGTNLQ